MNLPKTFIGKRDHINDIIESPNGSRNKYTFDPDKAIKLIQKLCNHGSN